MPPEKLTFRVGYEARRSFHGAADVVVCRVRTYKIKSRIARTLPYAAAGYGVAVYGREFVGYAARPRISLEQIFAALVGGIGERHGHLLPSHTPDLVPARLE